MNKIKLCTVAILLLLCTMVITFSDVFKVDAKTVSNIDAQSYILIDDSGKVLDSKNPHDKREVASICKLMTILITLENIEKDSFRCRKRIFGIRFIKKCNSCIC